MQKPNELDKAALRLEFRRLYNDIGPIACYQVLYELFVSAEVLSEVMLDENEKAEDARE